MQVITEKRGLTCEREQRKYIGGFRKGKGENKVILISIKEKKKKMKSMGECSGSLELPQQRSNNGQLTRLKVIVSILEDTGIDSRHRPSHACSDGANGEWLPPFWWLPPFFMLLGLWMHCFKLCFCSHMSSFPVHASMYSFPLWERHQPLDEDHLNYA